MAAEAQFQNLRNRNGREKRKLKEGNNSGAGAKDVNVRLSEIFLYLSWLEPYFVGRQRGTNFQFQTHLEYAQEEEQHGDDNISIASSDVYNNSGSLKNPLAVKQSDLNISKVTGQTLFTKQKRMLPESSEDVDFMNKLKEKLNSEKNDDNFMVICLQSSCGDYRAQVNYALNMKLTISCLNICFRMRKINKRMSKLLQEINLQVFRQPHQYPFREIILYINNRQSRQDNFQISTVFKHNKKAM